MIGVKRETPSGPDWTRWQERADQGTKDLLDDHQAGNEIAIKATLYKEAKPFLDKLFGGKCAYCEVLIETSHPIEVEHYRPKARYWWLAYQWTNLLPSCIDCNRRRGHGESGESGGKADIFPVKGQPAAKPGEEVNEVALLLNPCEADFNPTEHFEFLKDGTIKPKTERGAETCKLLGLNIREKAVARRASVFSEARRSFKSYVVWAISMAPETDDSTNDKAAVNNFWAGKTEFSAFGKIGLETFLGELRAKSSGFSNLTLPL